VTSIGSQARSGMALHLLAHSDAQNNRINGGSIDAHQLRRHNGSRYGLQTSSAGRTIHQQGGSMDLARTFHAMSADEAVAYLETDPQGLTEEQVAERLEHFGPNEIQEGQRTSKLGIFIEQFRNPFVYVLVFAGIISVLGGHEIDAIVIAVIIMVNAIIGFVQEYQAEEALQALKERAAPEATVRRRSNGESVETEIRATQVVPGDIIVLTTGAKVPADARLIEAANLSVDEAMLTGESHAATKSTPAVPEQAAVADRHNLVYGATAVTRGRGTAVVIGTGRETEIGRIATLIEETEKGESPIQQQMAVLGRWLAYLALAMSTIVFIIGLLRGFDIQSIFMLALAMAVSAIPEGLPAVLTITLAVGVNRMAKRHSIIRKLRAVDTLGAATVIVSDKTGTLTTNEMTVQQVMTGNNRIEVTGVGFQPDGRFRQNGHNIDPREDQALGLALQIGALCNDSRLINDRDNGTYRMRGDPTEGALLVSAVKGGYDLERLQRDYQRIDEIPFDSIQRFMATFHDQPNSDQVLVYVKGAPEKILDLSSHVRLKGDQDAPAEDHRAEIMEHNELMAESALRVLGLGYKVIDRDQIAEIREALETDKPVLTFVGLTGMIDPPRPEVADSVAECRRAGIRVIMATGDHLLTGKAIAQSIGILDRSGDALTGPDVDALSDEQLDVALHNTQVFARVSPTHKHRLVESLQRLDQVVAMTGDGVNDAPALRAAEIGIAMGITGTDVTKETSDMVLTDDNFSSIVAAIEEGRAVFQNVRKVVKFLLSTNMGEILTIMVSLILFGADVPIVTPIQILWVNLVTDGILDITIAMEPKEDDVMDGPPRRPNTPIINREIIFNTMFVAVFMAVGTLFVFFRDLNLHGLVHAQTMAFTTLAMFQVFNSLNVRSRTKSVFQLGLFTNRWLIGAIVVSIILQIMANQTGLLQTALGTAPLSFADWGVIVSVSSSVFIADELRKVFGRARGKTSAFAEGELVSQSR
jgi:P-type Ca2+ transporter type 2C